MIVKHEWLNTDLNNLVIGIADIISLGQIQAHASHQKL